MGKRSIAFVVLLILATLTGCGGSKDDISIFILPPQGITHEAAASVEQQLKAELGEGPVIKVSGSPIFDLNKEMVEVAAGDHTIYIFGEERFKVFASSGDLEELDELFDASLYPEGVVEVEIEDENGNVTKESHLYAVPVAESAIMKEAGYFGEELFAFMLPRTSDMDTARRILQLIAAP